FIPPDPYIAVGPNHVIQIVNSSFRITDKKGNSIKTINAVTWYSKLIPVDPFDPKIIYDHYENRWVMLWSHVNDAISEAFYILSVSDDEDPIGTWFTWFLPANVDGNTPSGAWADYPAIGFDDKAIYLTANNWAFSGGFQHVKIKIIEKSFLYVNDTASEVIWTDLWGMNYPGSSNSGFGLRPVRMHSTSDKYYFVNSEWWGGSHSTIALYELTDPLTNPHLTGEAIPTALYESPPTVEQLGGNELSIEGSGTQLRNEPVFQHDLIHLTHTAKYENVGGVRYLNIDVYNKTIPVDIIMGTPEHHHIYSALAVNQNDDVILTYTRSSANEYLGAYFAIIFESSVLLGGSNILQTGKDNYVVDFGSNRNRWGDYNGAWSDPSDPLSFWVYSEYTKAKNQWGTWIGAVRTGVFDQPFIFVNTDDISYGSLEIDGEGIIKYFTIANYGSENLVIQEISSAFSEFEIETDKTFPITITSLDTLELGLRFNPVEHGLFIYDTLVISSNSFNKPSAEISLVGGGFEITKVTKGIMYASTDKFPNGSGRILTIDPNSGSAEVLGKSGFRPVRSITINPNSKELIALNKTNLSPPNILRVRADDGEAMIFDEASVDIHVMAFDSDGLIHAITTDSIYYTVNFDNMETNLVKQLEVFLNSITIQPESGSIYVSKPNSDGNDNIYVLSSSGNLDLIGNTGLDKPIQAMAFDSDGNLYATIGEDLDYSRLVSIDPNNGEGIEIGETGVRGVIGLVFAIDGITDVKVENVVPDKFILLQNYPNPFNPSTTIKFSLPANSSVKISIINVLGEVVDILYQGNLTAGIYEYEWDVSNKKISSGIYIYSINAIGENGIEFYDSKKMLLLK
ncbi:T9SS type A sorting domain-containing protein, partial [Bacteroidota bacterium]